MKIVFRIVRRPSPFFSCPNMLGHSTIQTAHHEEYSSSDFHHAFSVFVVMHTRCARVLVLASPSCDAGGARLRRRNTHSFMWGLVQKLLEFVCGGVAASAVWGG